MDNQIKDWKAEAQWWKDMAILIAKYPVMHLPNCKIIECTCGLTSLRNIINAHNEKVNDGLLS